MSLGPWERDNEWDWDHPPILPSCSGAPSGLGPWRACESDISAAMTCARIHRWSDLWYDSSPGRDIGEHRCTRQRHYCQSDTPWWSKNDHLDQVTEACLRCLCSGLPPTLPTLPYFILSKLIMHLSLGAASQSGSFGAEQSRGRETITNITGSFRKGKSTATCRAQYR